MRFGQSTIGRDNGGRWQRGGTIATEPVGWPGALIVARGELDLSVVSRLRVELDAALGATVQRLVLDLGGVTFIDSISFAAIVAAKRRMPSGARMALVARHPYVLLILEAGGVDALVDVFSTREEAVAHVCA